MRSLEFRISSSEDIYHAAPLVIPSGKTSPVQGFLGDFIDLCGYEYDSANSLFKKNDRIDFFGLEN